jgi:hypothetical protein
VCVGDVWRAWERRRLDAADVAGRLGWSVESVRTLEAYRGVATRYSFPTLAEARASVARWFVERACHVPDYELGDRCPTLVLAPRGGL